MCACVPWCGMLCKVNIVIESIMQGHDLWCAACIRVYEYDDVKYLHKMICMHVNRFGYSMS